MLSPVADGAQSRRNPDTLAGMPDERDPASRAAQQARRETLLRRALNEAAVQPSSLVVVVEPDEVDPLPAIRIALARLMETEPRDLVWGVRDGRIVIANGELPPIHRARRGRGRS